jgi:hypothetical protein
MVQLFASYPADLVSLALDPIKGLPGQCEFVPSIAKANRFLADHLQERKEAEYWRRKSMLQIEPPTDPEMRERVGKMFVDLSRELKATA